MDVFKFSVQGLDSLNVKKPTGETTPRGASPARFAGAETVAKRPPAGSSPDPPRCDCARPGRAVLRDQPGPLFRRDGHHFARPGNRFWPALFASGFTPRLFTASEGRQLLPLGCGITNLVARTTAAADELDPAELRAGRQQLARKVRRFRPRVVAIVGVMAYRTAFNRPGATLGEQPEELEGARLWVLPNPSGLNAHHRPADFARAFLELRLSLHR